MRHVENDFIIPALRIVLSCPNGCTTETIINRIGTQMELFGEDSEPMRSRYQNEPRYKQIIRNMISHKNKKFLEYVKVSKNEKGKLLFKINKEGQKYIAKYYIGEQCALFEDEENLKESENDDLKEDIQSNNENIEDAYPKTENAYCEVEKCDYGKCIGEEHLSGENKKLYKQYLIPLEAQKDFFLSKLDIPENTILLCENCNKRYLNKDLKMIKILFDSREDKLKKRNIRISESKLISKYYGG